MFTRRDSKNFGGKISCASGTAMDARRTRGRALDGGRTPKTACLGVVLSSEHSTGHGFPICSNRCECGLFVRKFCLTRDLDRGLGAIKKKKGEREGEGGEEGGGEGGRRGEGRGGGGGRREEGGGGGREGEGEGGRE